MKRFITAMLFSLTVIVCQQQTLFAGLTIHSNVASVTADSEEGHRGIPIAGVDRLVPLAGASYNPGKGASYNPGMHDSREPIREVAGIPSCPEIRCEEEDQPFDYDLGPMDINGGSWSFFSRGLH